MSKVKHSVVKSSTQNMSKFISTDDSVWVRKDAILAVYVDEEDNEGRAAHLQTKIVRVLLSSGDELKLKANPSNFISFIEH